MIAGLTQLSISANEVIIYAMLGALLTLIPMTAAVVVALIRAYRTIKDAVIVGQSNHVALHETVIPALAQIQTEGETQHAETIAAINGNGGGTGGSTTHTA